MGKSIALAPLRSNIGEAAQYYKKFMEAVGLPFDADSQETPARVSRMFFNEFSSYHQDPPKVALFPAKGYDQYVTENEIQFSSLCSHHHLPFSGLVYFGYHPKTWLAGLSKIPRVVRHFSQRPQLQEHLTCNIADYLFEELKPHGVMVVIEASHACMQCRGIRDPRSCTVTSKIRGEVDKEEMLSLFKGFGKR